MAKKLKFETEWKIPVPWGELVLLRCGKPDGEPVMLIHGRQDSSTVFAPILEYMPDKYNYVALDMPGNGLSTPLPTGPKLTRLHFLSAMEFAVSHLGWNKFIFMGHSMGCEQGLFYNTVYPGRITRMILLDAVPTLMRMQIPDPAEFQRTYYDEYYKNYARDNFFKKCHTRTSAMSALRRLRDLSEAQAGQLLQRNFHPKTSEEKREQELQEQQRQQATDAGFDRMIARINHLRETDPEGYLSWDNRLKNLAPTNFGNDYYFQLFKTVPPTLLITASDGAKHVPKKWHKGAYELVDRLRTLKNFREVKVVGSHDVHFTHPERVAPHVMKFLVENNNISSKL